MGLLTFSGQDTHYIYYSTIAVGNLGSSWQQKKFELDDTIKKHK